MHHVETCGDHGDPIERVPHKGMTWHDIAMAPESAILAMGWHDYPSPNKYV